MGQINVAIIGVGNCPSSLVQGVHRYANAGIVGPSAYFMKSPPVQYTDSEARQMVEDFIVGRGE